MNIIYGGAFSPPTIAHYNIIRYLEENFICENIIIVPVGDDYNKPLLINELDRLNMLKLVTKDFKKVRISTIEFDKKFLGTYETLKHFSKEYNDLYYVIGADNLDYLNSWLNFDKLINEFKFIVFPRIGYNVEEIIESKYLKYKDRFIITNYRIDCSSTEYRETRNKELLTNDVYEYIIKKKIY